MTSVFVLCFYELWGLFLCPDMSYTETKRGQRLTNKLRSSSQKWAEQFTQQQLKGEGWMPEYKNSELIQHTLTCDEEGRTEGLL